MPKFIGLINFTDQGVQSINKSTKRADAAIEHAKKAGLAVKEVYWTTGPHDGVLILEAPDDKAATAFFLSLVNLGNVRATTMRAFDRTEFQSVVEDMG